MTSEPRLFKKFISYKRLVAVKMISVYQRWFDIYMHKVAFSYLYAFLTKLTNSSHYGLTRPGNRCGYATIIAIPTMPPPARNDRII